MIKKVIESSNNYKCFICDMLVGLKTVYNSVSKNKANRFLKRFTSFHTIFSFTFQEYRKAFKNVYEIIFTIFEISKIIKI